MDLPSLQYVSLDHIYDTKIVDNHSLVTDLPRLKNTVKPLSNEEQLSLKSDDFIMGKSVQLFVEQSQQRLVKEIKELNEYIKKANRGLAFELDEESGRQVITVYEVSSGDIIRQIPNKEMLEIALVTLLQRQSKVYLDLLVFTPQVRLD